jgi:SAM-dependent methyltransferase
MISYEVKDRLLTAAAGIIYCLLGTKRFYVTAQKGPRYLRIIAAFQLENQLARLVNDWRIKKADEFRSEITEEARRLYSDDNLAGYGDFEFKKTDGKPLLEQQRAVLVPYVASLIDSTRLQAAKVLSPRVVEIGCGNGDVIAHIAHVSPHVQAIGVDLSVANAVMKHSSFPNLRFEKGYAIELFESGVLKADIVFASSTFCTLAPLEFRRLLDAMERSSVRHLAIQDPIARFNHTANDGDLNSYHMSHEMWFHPYGPLLESRGWSVKAYNETNFHYSHNPSAKIVVCVATRK